MVSQEHISATTVWGRLVGPFYLRGFLVARSRFIFLAALYFTGERAAKRYGRLSGGWLLGKCIWRRGSLAANPPMIEDPFTSKLSGEELALYERAKQNHYVTIDERDLESGDPVAKAYRLWCQAARVPFVQIAIGHTHSHLTLNLMEIEVELAPEAEEQIRRRLPQECLMDAGIVCESDHLIAPHIRNESVFELARWIYDLARAQSETV